jgi:hypothetical protein
LKLIFITAALTAWCPALSRRASVQNNQSPEPYVVTGVDCSDEEHVKSLLDHAAITAGGDKTITIIARLGAGESSRKLIRRRLNAPVNYLVENRGVSKSRIVTAEGERLRRLGHVEIYVGGNLFITFRMKRGRDFGQGARCKTVYD